MRKKIEAGLEKIKTLEKYIVFFLYIGLFVALIIYSAKYLPTILNNVRSVGLSTITIVLMLQSTILWICALRLNYLLRPLNKKSFDLLKLFVVFNAASIFKYIPPKGINYYMRIKFMNRIKGLQGKITSAFGEFISELYISSICTLLLIYTIQKSTPFVKIALLFLILSASYLMVFPNTFLKIFNLFKLKLNKIRTLIYHFNKLVRKPEYYYVLCLTLFTVVLHGISLSLIFSSFGNYHISLLKLMIIFYSAQFISIIFMAPAGLGVRDVGIVSFLVAENVSMPDAISVSILHRALTFITEFGVGLVSLYLLKFKSNNENSKN